MKKRWVLSKSGIRHLAKGRNYFCNGALRHTGFFVKASNMHPTCANCSQRMVRKK